jgi:DNA primase
MTVDEILIRTKLPISYVVGARVELTRRGRSIVGQCPFHADTKRSFHVNEERGFYHCFGCGEHGDVIKFLQEMDGLEFSDAIEILKRLILLEALHQQARR